MDRHVSGTSPLAALFLVAAMTSGLGAQGTPIGFAEDFALAPDRGAVLDQLIPGTQEYYYYTCLYLQHSDRFGEVPALLDTWIRRHGRNGRVEEIENRQALLTYGKDPEATLRHLRDRLGLRFDHERQIPGSKPDLPTRLDASLISFQTLYRKAMEADRQGLDRFQDSALEILAGTNLDDNQLHHLLGRLQRPDVSNLPALVVRDLDSKLGQGFGSLAIHRQLLRDQLEECLRLKPALRNDAQFVNVYLRRLSPGPDEDWYDDPVARQAYLDALEGFVQRLGPAFHSLKAHVAYHRLVHDHRQGVHDRQRFLDYLRLPRNAPHVNLGDEFPTRLDRVGDDTALVRAYFLHFFRTDDSYEGFRPYLKEEYLRRQFAEAKILFGVGDMEQWYSMLNDPAYYERLKERVEIEFAPTQPTWFATDGSVGIDVDLKNVRTLLVKVFEINTFNYYREQEKEVDASINLDGLIANHEATFTYDESPFRRVRRHFDFPEVAGPGVTIVEFIGNGMSSRAVIEKGRLQLIQRVGAAGHVLRILDERGAPAAGASLWMGGRTFLPDEDGDVVVPFSTEGGTPTAIARQGDLCSLVNLRHERESYDLHASFYLDRESLLPRRTARILVRPQLTVNGARASLDLLEDATLTVQSVDHEGVSSSLEVEGFALHEDQESVHEIQVPENLRALTVRLAGKVRNLSKAEDVTLHSEAVTFPVNGIEATAETAAAFLGRSTQGYSLDVLGKDGEPLAEFPLVLRLQHRHFRDPVQVSLKTDAGGRIHLGSLQDITHVKALGLPSDHGTWSLRSFDHTVDPERFGAAGRTLRVPYLGDARRLSRELVSLLETRQGDYLRDRYEHLALVDGYLELRDLPAGDYQLFLKETGHAVAVHLTAGEVRDGWVQGPLRMLPTEGDTPLQITQVDDLDDDVVIRLGGVGPDTRVHLVATRYLAAFQPFDRMVTPSLRDREASWRIRSEATYHSGREIGDEYRYILERRQAQKFPGNMLARPGLLLNPWALDETSTAVGAGGGSGGRFGGRDARGGVGYGPAAPSRKAEGEGLDPGLFANLDFLPGPSVILANLKPDARGFLRVPRADLGDGQLVHVLAADATDTAYTTHVLGEIPLEPETRALTQALPPDGHFTEQRQIDFLAGGATAVLEDVTTAHAEIYDSLAAVYQLFLTLSDSDDLREFSFLLQWPGLSAEEKRAKYSTYACHELHFFLHQKDPEFFDEVVRPYLACKMDKTFLDHWLLEDDLDAFLDPWAFARLNLFERILLARRMAGRGAEVQRHLRDLFELVPPDPEQERFRFTSALKSRDLAAVDQFGEALEKAKSLAVPGAGGPATPGPDRSIRRRAGNKGGEYRGPGDTGAPADAKALADEPMEEMEVLEGESEDRDAEGAGARELGRASRKDALLREEQRAFYRAPDPTRELVEHNYWHRRNHEHDGSLIPINAFWLDFAGTPAGRPFVSRHFLQATAHANEMLLALAVLDLPFQPTDVETALDGRRMTLTAADRLLLLRREIKAAPLAEDGLPLLVSQNFFRQDDRYRFEGNQRYDKYVSREFLRGVVYGCQVVLTNPTSAPRQLELLLQIPKGAIPVAGGFETRGAGVQLGAYSTTTQEYYFYFPHAGDTTHYPVHVSQDGALVAAADPLAMHVVEEPSVVDTTSWEHVSQNGTGPEVLQRLRDANLYRVDLGRIAWRMKDRAFFQAAVDALRHRHVFDATLWSYGVLHQDPDAVREWLEHQDAFLARCGRALTSPLVDIDPVERHAWQFIEYAPLFNPRAHRFGRQREILNASLARQYLDTLAVLAYRPALDSEDWMTVTYYHLLQDRVADALDSFRRVDPAQVPMRIQYDYLRAYLDFFTDRPGVARTIAQQYTSHPVDRWRARFQEILDQMDEAQGATLASRDTEDKDQQQAALAASEPVLDLEIEGRRLVLNHGNLERCEVNYYEMDIEFLFSTNPFVQQGSGSFAYVRPNRSDVLSLPKDGKVTAFDLPAEFQSSNVLVEVRAGGLVRRKACFVNTLAVHTIENYGQLRVTDAGDGKPLPKVYVKVYARVPGGNVVFRKDGYTDLRGRFDYASLSGDDVPEAERYSILVLSEEHGAVVREVAPPLE